MYTHHLTPSDSPFYVSCPPLPKGNDGYYWQTWHPLDMGEWKTLPLRWERAYDARHYSAENDFDKHMVLTRRKDGKSEVIVDLPCREMDAWNTLAGQLIALTPDEFSSVRVGEHYFTKLCLVSRGLSRAAAEVQTLFSAGRVVEVDYPDAIARFESVDSRITHNRDLGHMYRFSQ